MSNNIELGFDMFIKKNTITPWHHDAAYCVNMPYKGYVNCWLPFDASYKLNDRMWHAPKLNIAPLLPHSKTGNKGALRYEGSKENSVYIPLALSSCVFHQGAALQ